MARLRHPNVVSFMAICVDPPCIVTEYCSRRSLYDVLRTAARAEEATGNAGPAGELAWRRRLAMVSVVLGCAHGQRQLAWSGGAEEWAAQPTIGSACCDTLRLLRRAVWHAVPACRSLWMPPLACCTCTPARHPSYTETSSHPTCWLTNPGV